MGSWEHFTAFDYKASLLYKLYNQRDSLKLFKLLLDSGFKFPLNRIDMIIGMITLKCIDLIIKNVFETK